MAQSAEIYEWNAPRTGPTRELKLPYDDEPQRIFDFHEAKKPDITVRIALRSMTPKELREAGLIGKQRKTPRPYYTDRNGVTHNMEPTRIKRQGQGESPVDLNINLSSFNRSCLTPIKKALDRNNMVMIDI